MTPIFPGKADDEWTEILRATVAAVLFPSKRCVIFDCWGFFLHLLGPPSNRTHRILNLSPGFIVVELNVLFPTCPEIMYIKVFSKRHFILLFGDTPQPG